MLFSLLYSHFTENICKLYEIMMHHASTNTFILLFFVNETCISVNVNGCLAAWPNPFPFHFTALKETPGRKEITVSLHVSFN